MLSRDFNTKLKLNFLHTSIYQDLAKEQLAIPTAATDKFRNENNIYIFF